MTVEETQTRAEVERRGRGEQGQVRDEAITTDTRITILNVIDRPIQGAVKHSGKRTDLLTLEKECIDLIDRARAKLFSVVYLWCKEQIKAALCCLVT